MAYTINLTFAENVHPNHSLMKVLGGRLVISVVNLEYTISVLFVK